MIRNNDIRGGPAWSVTIGPQDGLKDEWVREVLIEKNTVDDNKYLASAAFYINSSNTTLRDNQFVGGAGAIWDYSCIMVTRHGLVQRAGQAGDSLGVDDLPRVRGIRREWQALHGEQRRAGAL